VHTGEGALPGRARAAHPDTVSADLRDQVPDTALVALQDQVQAAHTGPAAAPAPSRARAHQAVIIAAVLQAAIAAAPTFQKVVSAA